MTLAQAQRGKAVVWILLWVVVVVTVVGFCVGAES